jgi:cytidine deaminase
VKGLVFSSFNIKAAQPRFVRAEKKMATTQQAVNGHASRAANRMSKSLSKFPAGGSRFGATKLEVAIAATTKALAVFKGALAELKEHISSVCREPKQGSGCGGCRNVIGELEVMQQTALPDLIAGRGTGN